MFLMFGFCSSRKKVVFSVTFCKKCLFLKALSPMQGNRFVNLLTLQYTLSNKIVDFKHALFLLIDIACTRSLKRKEISQWMY
ncbi:hypothetical protein D931_03390 [Enterococcus faecium 13.SD.W.09]|jgi:hypothetical protein|nr:hypothetical protein D931_03390 [Enterococcus faecium 13.SD.W.09]